ncbi:hypothetical protein ACIRU3_25725 [Streptomyces sp. NPDC101151]|uniref:hypothetical protein n=1 Tax=Streptomyces sp. NPDC101151 TaxID=3366115 RepID=UPI0037F821F8
MDLDTVADELYGLRPEEFVAARDRHAAQARTSGEQDLAREIAALRRPSLAAWTSNLLVRGLPEEVQPLLGLGEELRRAHRELDGPQLRLLARRQTEVIGALGRQARRLAGEAGHPVGEGVQREVEETLHAVLADPGAAREWAAGRLVKPLSAAIGFPAADEAAVGRRSAPAPRPNRQPTPKPGQRAGDRERARDSAGERAEDEERRRRLSEARKEARDAERELRARQKEAKAAEAEAEKAARRSASAEGRLRELREQTRRAQEEQGRARAEERNARARARTADRDAHEARRRAGAAGARVERLAANRLHESS